MKVLYTAVATADGDGRNGHVRTDDGFIDTNLSTPTGLGGVGGATNPEQLFAAGYSACFLSAIKATKAKHGVPVEDASVTAEVSIGPRDAGGFGLAVALHIEMGGGVSQQDAERAAAAAHEVCPYSNATRGNIEVTLHVDAA